jgi:CubicO group peptidase (beta-lactamase class C family)
MQKSFLLSFMLLIFCSMKVLMAQRYATITPCSKDSIHAWMKRYHVPAVGIGIIANGKIKSIKVYGEIRKGAPAPKNAIWNIASMTKPVTALTVLKLVDKGEWELNEPVSKYFIDPDIKDNPWTAKLTTSIFLSHSTGFKNWRKLEPDKKLTFHFEPGTRFGYSGAGYEYLRKALEKKLGKSLQELAEEVLLIPAGMKDTHFGWDNSLDSTRFAEAHNDKGVIYTFKYIHNNAADWLVTSVKDYCKFGIYVMNGAGLSQKLYDNMTSIHTNFDTTVANRSNGMGLGWQVIRDLPHGEFALTHDGDDDGVATIGLFLPKSKRGIVIFTNGDDGKMLYSQILKASKIDLQPELAKYMEPFR